MRKTSPIDTSISGHCESGFGPVADVLRTQLGQDLDSGASVGVYRSGSPVVAIWGGTAELSRPFRAPTYRFTPLTEAVYRCVGIQRPTR